MQSAGTYSARWTRTEVSAVRPRRPWGSPARPCTPRCGVWGSRVRRRRLEGAARRPPRGPPPPGRPSWRTDVSAEWFQKLAVERAHGLVHPRFVDQHADPEARGAEAQEREVEPLDHVEAGADVAIAGIDAGADGGHRPHALAHDHVREATPEVLPEGRVIRKVLEGQDEGGPGGLGAELLAARRERVEGLEKRGEAGGRLAAEGEGHETPLAGHAHDPARRPWREAPDD